jgi:hypothetical protein
MVVGTLNAGGVPQEKPGMIRAVSGALASLRLKKPLLPRYGKKKGRATRASKPDQTRKK